LTINNTGTGVTGLTLTETANSAGTITFTGTGLTTVALTDTVAGVLSLVNSGTGSVSINDGGATVATTVNLTGAMTVTLTDSNVSTWTLSDGQTATLVDNKATGLTLNAGSDNSHISFTTSGATGGVSTVVDNLTVGNANNSISDASTTNTVNVTVGTGSNLITLGAASTGGLGLLGGNTTGLFNVTLGAHTATTGIDSIFVGTAGTNFATAPNYVITGSVTGDKITFANDAASSATALTATVLTNAVTLAGALTTLEAAAAAAHSVAYGVYQGNTYVVENLLGAATATSLTVVELVGSHTLTAAAGNVVLAS
jgi:hypothetical protein